MQLESLCHYLYHEYIVSKFTSAGRDLAWFEAANTATRSVLYTRFHVILKRSLHHAVDGLV